MNHRQRLPKKFLMLLICVLFLLLAGCTDTRISCGIDAEYNAYMNIDIRADLTEVDADRARAVRSSLRKLANYYQNILGYSVETTIREEEDIARVQMTLIRPADSYAEAFDQLKSILTDETLTPFTTVDAARTDGAFEQGYAVTGSLDADKLLRASRIDSLPKEMGDFLRQGIAESTAVIELTLPASEVVEHSGDIVRDGAFVCAATPLALDARTDVTLVTRASLVNGEAASVPLTDAIAGLRRETAMATVACAVAAALFVPCIVLLIVRVVRRRRGSGPRTGE